MEKSGRNGQLSCFDWVGLLYFSLSLSLSLSLSPSLSLSQFNCNCIVITFSSEIKPLEAKIYLRKNLDTLVLTGYFKF
jgi:hypothetical protein